MKKLVAQYLIGVLLALIWGSLAITFDALWLRQLFVVVALVAAHLLGVFIGVAYTLLDEKKARGSGMKYEAEFARAIEILMRESGDGIVYFVGENYEEAARLFEQYLSKNGYPLKRVDCIAFVSELDQESVSFWKETPKGAEYTDAVIELEAKP